MSLVTKAGACYNTSCQETNFNSSMKLQFTIILTIYNKQAYKESYNAFKTYKKKKKREKEFRKWTAI